MGGRLPTGASPVVPFGAAAGYPSGDRLLGGGLAAGGATGRRGDRRRRCDAATGLGRRLAGAAPAHPPAARLRVGGPARSRTGRSWRRSSTPSSTCPVDVWAPYLRVDSPPGGGRSGRCRLWCGDCPWSMRRRLLANPSAVVERLAHGEHPADHDAGGEDEPLHGVGQVRALGQLGHRRPAPGTGRSRRARRHQLDVHRHERLGQLRREAVDVDALHLGELARRRGR